MKYSFFILFVLFLIPAVTHAETFHRITGSLNSSASVFHYSGGVPDAGTSGGASYRFYRGSYPDTSTSIQSGGSSDDTWERYATTTIATYASASLALGNDHYWIALWEGSYPNIRYYFQWEVFSSQILSAGFGTEGVLDTVTNTRFTDVNVTGTSSVNVAVQYFLDESEVDSSNAVKYVTNVRYSYALRPGTTFSTVGQNINPTAFGIQNSSTTLSGLADGVYDLQVQFGNSGTSITGVVPFPNAYAVTNFTLAGGVITATGTVEYFNGTPQSTDSKYTYQECGVTHIEGCINNAFVYLFIPESQAVTESYTSLQTALAQNMPFAYIVAAYDSFSAFASTTGSTTSPTASFDLPLGGTVLVFGGTTTDFIPSEVRTGALALMQAGMWLAWVFAIWATRHGIFT